MSGPSGKLGGLSTSVVAIIAVGGVAGLLALIVVTSLILDIPKRMKQKKNTGLMAPEEMEKKSVEIDDAEKGAIKQATREISVQSPSFLFEYHNVKMSLSALHLVFYDTFL
ncbi:hypothetical protein J4E85_004563 [Alternaria conjuncta]|uniref:uncharacterized protein n=1 Tax=Alternaria conjuncta TaxID=181017 RepID=UPI00221FC501|nr:uncharacterized protein J4E85_004563 [Alternaria conjuncta]KAI4929942.1 hypothetical protein J4E85_004563 [Alternaria conjuncta]